MIRQLLIMIDYEGHLRKAHPDWDSRWENVQELITFASESETAIEPQPVLGEGTSEASGKECVFRGLTRPPCVYIYI